MSWSSNLVNQFKAYLNYEYDKNRMVNRELLIELMV
jgi:hypothetical protein